MRSKPDPVDQSERTAYYDCATCTAEMLHNIITQRQFCCPHPPGQHHCSDEAKWRLGRGESRGVESLVTHSGKFMIVAGQTRSLLRAEQRQEHAGTDVRGIYYKTTRLCQQT